MSSLVKLLLFPALAFCAFVSFLFFIGGGTTGREVDALKGFLIGGPALAACAYCGYRIYFGSDLAGWEWLALAVALSPIALFLIMMVRKTG
jgi:hypothetical protein